jgi:hypothetical protein
MLTCLPRCIHGNPREQVKHASHHILISNTLLSSVTVRYNMRAGPDIYARGGDRTYSWRHSGCKLSGAFAERLLGNCQNNTNFLQESLPTAGIQGETA